MRLIITYYTGFLQKRTDKLDIDPTLTTTNLLQSISNKIGRPVKDLKVKFKRDGYTLKVLPGWPLSHYDFQQGNNINVEIKESEEEQKKKENTRVNARYLNKLGIGIKQQLDVVSEGSFDEDDSEEIHQQSQGKVSEDHSFQNMSSDDEGQVQTTKSEVYQQLHQYNEFNEQKCLDQFQEQMFRIIKKNNIEQIDYLINHQEENQQFSSTIYEQVKQKKLKLLNDASLGGWNPIHFVAFQNYSKLVTYLLERGVDLNKVTSDGWSPLQLAIHKNNIDGIKLIKTFLSMKEIDVNLITNKGLALNLACKSGKINMVQMILQAGADPLKVDEKGINALQCCSSQEMTNIINQHIKKKQSDSQQVQEKPQRNSGTFHPPKPPIVKGFIFKTGALLVNNNLRYLVLNSDEGTLIRYKTINDYPLNPLEIIPLKNIRSVKMAEKQWFMRNDLHYFEVYYTSRLILGCKFENSAKAWVSFIYQAAVYSIYLEGKSEHLDEIIQQNNLKQTSEIQIKDDKEELDFDSNLIIKSQNQAQKNTQIPEKKFTEKDSNPIQSVDVPVMPHSRQLSEENANQNIRLETSNQKIESQKSQLENDLETKNGMKSLFKDYKVNFDSFEVVKVLGSGAFGKVFLVRKKDDNKQFAMKALKKRNLIVKKQLKYAVTEANVLKSCNHPFILGLHYAFQTPNYLYLVLDYCPGGDLSYHLAQKTKFSEEDARFYIAELILAIEYLHQQNVIYRDLKPENILLHESGHIKLADFGLSKEGVGDTDKTKSFCGSPAYLSPEMLGQKGAGKMSDIYGIGATFYELVTGEPPYYSDDIPTMYKNIKEGQLKLPKYLSEEAKMLIKRLLERDPTKRLGAKDKNEIKNDPFFRSIDFNKLYNQEYKPPIIDFHSLQDDDEDNDDIGYKGKQLFNDYDYGEDNVKVNRVIKFSFSRQMDKK